MIHKIPPSKIFYVRHMTAPKETVQPDKNFTRVFVRDKMFDVKINSAIELDELINKPFQIN